MHGDSLRRSLSREPYAFSLLYKGASCELVSLPDITFMIQRKSMNVRSGPGRNIRLGLAVALSGFVK